MNDGVMKLVFIWIYGGWESIVCLLKNDPNVCMLSVASHSNILCARYEIGCNVAFLVGFKEAKYNYDSATPTSL